MKVEVWETRVSVVGGIFSPFIAEELLKMSRGRREGFF